MVKSNTMKEGKSLVVKIWGILWLLLLTQCGPAVKENSEPLNEPAFRDSLDFLTSQIALHPGSEELRLHRARIFYRKQAYDAALKDVEFAMKIDSMELSTYLFKSKIELDYFRSLEALRTLRKAESKWPESALVKEKMSETYLILKQYQSAREKASEALTLAPSAARPYLILGLISKESNDTIAAIQYLKKAVQNDADLLDAWIELAHLQMERDPDAASIYFESALQIAPDDIRLLHTYALFWQEQDSLNHSKEIYGKIGVLDSNYLEAYFNNALILMDQDSFQRALQLWNIYVQKAPQSAKGYYYRGISFEMRGEHDQALSDYRRARDLDPSLESINLAIESLLKSLE